MGLRALGLMTVGLLALAATPSAAQYMSHPRDRTQSAESSPQDIRALGHFARCIADRQRDRTRAILAMDDRSVAYLSELYRLAQSNRGCGPMGFMRFGVQLYVGGLAEAVLHHYVAMSDFARLVVADAARPRLEASNPNDTAALCSVRAAPDAAAAMLATEPATPEESVALGALVPTLSTCLGAGRAIRINRESMRALIALAAYRIGEHVGWATASPAR